MFAALAQLVEELEVPVDGDAISAVVGVIDVLSAKVVEAIGEFDAAGLWDLDGVTSMTAWLRDHGNQTGGGAGFLVRIAHRVRELPVTAAAWRDGTLSGGQVKAVVANVDDRTVELFASHEAELVPVLAPLSVTDTVTAMREWKAKADAVVDAPEPPDRPDVLHWSKSLDGRRHVTATFGPDAAAAIEAALRLADTWDGCGERRSPAQRRADALADVCRYFLDHQRVRLGGRHRPHLNVIVQLDDELGVRRGRLLDRTWLTEAGTRALLCDCNLHRVVLAGDSGVLDYGRSTRTAPAALFSALAVRDGGCRHPGCDRPPEWCDAHHVIEWEHGGQTSIANMVLKCRRHHILGHKKGWSERLELDGTLHITSPDGRSWTTQPGKRFPLPLPLPDLAA